MTKYTEDNLKYIQEKIEQGYELYECDEYADTYCLEKPNRCSDYMMEKFNKFTEAFINKCKEEGKNPKEEFIKTRFVICKGELGKIEFPELRSINQVAQIIDIYQFDTKSIMYNPLNRHIEIYVKDGAGKWF